MIYYRKTLSSSGLKLTVVQLHLKVFVLQVHNFFFQIDILQFQVTDSEMMCSYGVLN